MTSGDLEPIPDQPPDDTGPIDLDWREVDNDGQAPGASAADLAGETLEVAHGVRVGGLISNAAAAVFRRRKPREFTLYRLPECPRCFALCGDRRALYRHEEAAHGIQGGSRAAIIARIADLQNELYELHQEAREDL